MSLRFNFTKRGIEELEPPVGERVHFYDNRTPSLVLSITPNGVKTFYVYKRVAGRPRRFALGRFPEMTIEQARTKAAELNGKVAVGIDPGEQKRQARDELTFKQIFDSFIEKHSKPHKRTWKEDEVKYKLHLSQWGGRRATSITHDDVLALHLKIGEKHSGAANRVLALLSSVFNFAKLDHNPVKGVKRFNEAERDRFLSGDELPKFFAALKDEPSDAMRDFFALLLWTGVRKGNLQSARWAEFNLADATWRIPAEKFKTGVGMTVHLSGEALKVLRRRHEANGESEWVFPSYSKSGHIVEPKKAWAALLERAGLSDVRIHDLRRTFGSWQAGTGASLSVIGKSLGHRNVKTTAIYSRLDLNPVRAAVDAATAAMMAAGKVKKVRGASRKG